MAPPSDVPRTMDDESDIRTVCLAVARGLVPIEEARAAVFGRTAPGPVSLTLRIAPQPEPSTASERETFARVFQELFHQAPPEVLLAEDEALARALAAQGVVDLRHVEECLALQRKLASGGMRPIPRVGRLLMGKGYLRAGADPELALSETRLQEMPEEARLAVQIPDRRWGKYVRVWMLGRGGMGQVWKAWDTKLRRWAALKQMHEPEGPAREIFEREARMAAGLEHPNIAKVYEVGEHGGAPYIAMQYVDGDTLEAARARLRLEDKIRAVREAGAALRHAHAQGVIHRDVKPANVMVDRADRVYLMDFGLAKRTTVDRPAAGSMFVLGTPSYMSPEQARGQADARSDVYGLAATLYSLVTGRPPFQGETAAEILLQVTTQDPVWPSRLCPGLSPDLEAIVLKGLEKNPRRRYADVAQFLEDLDAFARHEPLRHARRPSFGYVLGKRIRKHPLLWGLAAALALSIAGGAAFGGGQLLRAKRNAEQAAREHEAGERKEAAQKRLSILQSEVLARKDELRKLRVDPEAGRRALLATISEIGRFIDEWPSRPHGYYVRARAHFYLGDLASAERDARRSLEVEPAFRPGRTLLGMILLERYEEALAGPERAEIPALLDEAIASVEAGWEAGREREESARWGLPWTREDQVAVRLTEWIRRNAKRPTPWDAAPLREAWAEYQAEEYAYFIAVRGAASFEESIEWSSRALDVARGYDRAWFARGNAKTALMRYRGAILDYDRFLSLRNSPWGLSMRAYAKMQIRDYEGAAADATKALELKPDAAAALLVRGRAWLLLGEHDRAIGDFDRLLTSTPDNTRALTFRGMIRLRRGDREAAIRDLRRAVELDPEYARPHFHLGEAGAGGAGFPGGRDREFDRAEVLGFDEGDMGIEAAETALIRKDIPAAARLLARVGDRAEAHYWRGVLREQKGEDPTRHYEQSAALGSRDPELYFRLGSARSRKDDWAGAAREFTQAITLEPEYVEAHFGRGRALWNLGNLQGAVFDLTRALELRPDYGEAHLARGQAWAELRSYRAALRDFDRAVELRPKDVVAWIERGRIWLDLEDPGRAVSDFTEALRLEPDNAEAHFRRGTAHFDLQAYDRADADFGRAIELKPDRPAGYVERARSRAARRRFREALSDLDRAIALGPENPTAHFLRGKVHADLGEASKAVADLTEAIRLDEKHAQAYFERGRVRRESDPAAAVADFEQAIRRKPGYAEAHCELGFCRLRQGQNEEAAHSFSVAIRIDRNYPEAYEGRADAKLGLRDVEGAIADLEQALRAAPAEWPRRKAVEERLAKLRK